jgi:tetraacyldisaccharide-1-P 4'-kinase
LSVVSDHHDFTATDIAAIKNKAGNNIIVTTEKDYVRLKGSLPVEQLFIYQYKVLLLMKVLNLTKLLMIMWDKVQETVQFIKAKMILTLNMVLY